MFAANRSLIAETAETHYSLWTSRSKRISNQLIENAASVEFCYSFQRNSAYFVANVLVPSILINYLGGCSFLIPCHCGEKTGFGVTVFLAQTVNLMSISQYVPEGGRELPVFQKYLLESILFFVAIVFMNILLTTVAQTKRPQSIISSQPWKFILEKCSPIIFPGWSRRILATETTESPSRDSSNSAPEEGTLQLDNIRSVPSKREQCCGKEGASEQIELVGETANRLLLITSFIVISICTGYMLAVVLTQ